MREIAPSKVYRLLYPSVPAILGCSNEGRVYAMPVVSIISLSNEPALVGVSASPSHATHAAVVRSGSFSVSWLDMADARAVEVLGTTSVPPSGDKLLAAGLQHEKGKVLGVPVPKRAVAALECTLSSRHVFGDHELLVGNVVQAQAEDDFDEYWRFERYDPILYGGLPGGVFTTYRLGRERSEPGKGS